MDQPSQVEFVVALFGGVIFAVEWGQRKLTHDNLRLVPTCSSTDTLVSVEHFTAAVAIYE